MNCKNLKWNFFTVNDNGTIALSGYDIAFENRNAFTVFVNNYPVLPNVPFIINSLQPGKKFCQSFEINFAGGVGTLFIHVNEDDC
jgi:hypothetical protein